MGPQQVTALHVLAKPGPDGARSKAATEVLAAAREFGFEPTELEVGSADAIADRIVDAADAITRLVLVGGDGLIHRALPALVETGIETGLVPAGTGNDFARGVALDRGSDWDRHRRAFTGRTRPTDVLSTDDGRFVASVVTAGFSGEVNRRANAMRFPRGRARYTVATLGELGRLQPIDVTIRTEHGEIAESLAFFAVANTCYFGGGMKICPTAEADDGVLDITLVDAVSPLALGAVLPLVFVGQHVRHPAVTTLRSRWVEVETTAPLWADGEPFGSGPIRFEAGVAQVLLAR